MIPAKAVHCFSLDPAIPCGESSGMSFAVLSTGTELSSGRTQDTNAPWIAGALAKSGYSVQGFATLPDDPQELADGILHFLNRSEYGVIMTGGLGPTDDDYTVDVLSRLTGKPPVEDPASARKLDILMRRFPGRFQSESARRQIRVVEGCHPLRNENGMAPGMIVSVNGRIVAAMPGVPQEMKRMFEEELLPELKKRFAPKKQGRRDFYLYALGESKLQSEWFDPVRKAGTLPPDFVWGVTAARGSLKVFLESESAEALDRMETRARTAYPDLFLPIPAEDDLFTLCTERKLMIGFAESCTGGLASKIITDRPGSSGFFAGGVLAYSNAVKEKLLGVSPDILREHGAVSDPCARAMAEGVVRELGVDFALSITGVAGPGGGSDEKPVGTVFIGCAGRGRASQAHKVFFPLDRDRVREYSAHIAIFRLTQFIRSAENQ